MQQGTDSRYSERDPERDAERSELIEHAKRLVPHLRQRVEEMDRLGRLPEATVNELVESGALRMTTPRIYGGLQVDLRTYLDVVSEIGRGDASTAWVVSLYNASSWTAATLFPEEAQQEVFNIPGGARVCSVLNPRRCTVKRVEGGYLIEEGLWGFNSGAYHANWDILGIPLPDENGEVTDQGLAILPMEEVKLLHDWKTIGMQGTGSTSVTVHDIFVPAHRVASVSHATEGRYNSPNLRDEYEYRRAFVPTLTIILAFPVLGAARGMLELFLERLPKRGIQYTSYSRQGEAPLTHLQVAQAASKIDSAQMVLQRAVDDIESWSRRDTYMEFMNRARVRMDTGYAAQLLYEAADIIGEASGGSFAAMSNPLNHPWRDIRTGTLHAVMNPNTNLELYGRLLCGLPANTPLV